MSASIHHTRLTSHVGKKILWDSAKLSASVLLGVATTSCAIFPADQSSHVLEGRTWELVEMQMAAGNTTTLSPAQQNRHTLSFAGDGTVSLRLDCNSGLADWSAAQPVDGLGVLTIGQVAATRALCPSPSFGEDMAADLPQAQQYSISADGRKLRIVTRHVTFIFQ